MKLKYFAWIKEITKKNTEELNDNSIIDVETLISYICIKYPKLKSHFKKNKMIRVALNYEYVRSNKKLSKNDEVAFFPPVSGG